MATKTTATKKVETKPVEVKAAVKEEAKVATTAAKTETKKAATKTTAAKAETKKATTKATAAKTETKKAAAKAETKKTAAKTTAKKTATKKAAKKENNVFVQFAGMEFDTAVIEKAVKADYAAKNGKKTATSVNIYVKPEDMKAYYVIDGIIGDVAL